jgi:hypothetical protein
MKKLYLFIFLAGFVIVSVIVFRLSANYSWKKLSGKVKVSRTEKGFQLIRNNQPYFIKGAAADQNFDAIPEYGGNSIRTWDTSNAQQILDKADSLGLTVVLGIYVGHERHGFKYSDKKAVKAQLENIEKQVRKYKDHPALLMWGVGNELDHLSTDWRVWPALNEIAKMIHRVDPEHPVTTMLATPGKKNIWTIKLLAPEIDILSVNTFGDLPNIPWKIKENGWDGPYIVTEWGSHGFWEADRTFWDAPLEDNSYGKAYLLKNRYEASIREDTRNCLGSYVFYWGNKQERTPTWFSLFTEDGKPTAQLDMMQYLWTGSESSSPAPSIRKFLVDGREAREELWLDADSVYSAALEFTDKRTDLTYRWVLMNEVRGMQLREGGDKEIRPKPVKGSIPENMNSGIIWFRTPKKEGAYRLYVYATDKNGKTATANFPFYVLR